MITPILRGGLRKIAEGSVLHDPHDIVRRDYMTQYCNALTTIAQQKSSWFRMTDFVIAPIRLLRRDANVSARKLKRCCTSPWRCGGGSHWAGSAASHGAASGLMRGWWQGRPCIRQARLLSRIILPDCIARGSEGSSEVFQINQYLHAEYCWTRSQNSSMNFIAGWSRVSGIPPYGEWIHIMSNW